MNLQLCSSSFCRINVMTYQVKNIFIGNALNDHDLAIWEGGQIYPQLEHKVLTKIIMISCTQNKKWYAFIQKLFP